MRKKKPGSSFRFKRILALLLCCVLLTGCAGRTEDPVSGASPTTMPAEGSPTNMLVGGSPTTMPTGASPTDTPAVTSPEKASRLMIDRNQIFDIDVHDEYEKERGRIAGVQFYQGEPVMLEVKAYDYVHESILIDEQTREYEEILETKVCEDSGLYIRRVDGSLELLIPGGKFLESIGSLLSEEEREKEFNALTDNRFISGGTWYVDGEGNCYYTTCCRSYATPIGKECFLKMDKNGELLYKTVLEPGFEAAGFGCIGGDMYVILYGKVDGTKVQRVVPFDPETGELADTDAFVLQIGVIEGANCLGWGEDGLYLYESSAGRMSPDAVISDGVLISGTIEQVNRGIKKIDLSDGSISDFLIFEGSAWTSLHNPKIPWRMKGFKVLEEGGVEVLYFSDEIDGVIGRSVLGLYEKLSMVEGGRRVVTLRAETIPAWVKLQAVEFNKTDPEYWVVLEELDTSKAADLADYARQTNIELSTGKGPDILGGSLIEEYLQGMLAKGMFLELGGSLDAMGVSEGDLLPAALGSWKEGDKIYGISAYLSPRGYKIGRDALPAGNGALDIRSLMDALSAREEPAVYYAWEDAGGNLKLFLEGSEDLWGMVDWERGSCDFSGDLFTQILEVSKRYGYDSRYRYQHLVRRIDYSDIYHFESRAELEAEDMVISGVLFDDGCHGYVGNSDVWAVNAASPQKEGALRFLGYLLGEKAQAEVTYAVPVNRTVLGQWIQKDLEKIELGRNTFYGMEGYAYGSYYVDEGNIVKYQRILTKEDMTEERIEEYLKTLEDVRPLPYRTAPILDIVYEEAEYYFNGSKSIRDVAEVIHNRVQLYLDENKR